MLRHMWGRTDVLMFEKRKRGGQFCATVGEEKVERVGGGVGDPSSSYHMLHGSLANESKRGVINAVNGHFLFTCSYVFPKPTSNQIKG